MLLIAGVAKIVSAYGDAKALTVSDPVLGMPFRYVFGGAGTVELLVALICLFGREVKLQTGLIAWLGITLLLYRFSLYWRNYHEPCRCLGAFTDALHISTESADRIMKYVLAYVLIGSLSSLIFLCVRREPKSGRLSVKMASDAHTDSQSAGC
jgi:hypothetical protein